MFKFLDNIKSIFEKNIIIINKTLKLEKKNNDCIIIILAWHVIFLGMWHGNTIYACIYIYIVSKYYIYICDGYGHKRPLPVLYLYNLYIYNK